MRHKQIWLPENAGNTHKAHHVHIEYSDGTSIRVDGTMSANDLPQIARAAGASKARGKAYEVDALGFIVSIVELIGL